MQQGSIAWLEMRKTKIGASDAPIIMGKSPYSTPYQLWLEKTKRVENVRKSNFAIERGNRWEPAARARYELETGLELPPTILYSKEYPFMMASLDGYSREAGVVLEIKIPGDEVFQMAKSGKVHPKYFPQVQHQLFVSKANEAHFFCCKVDKINGQERIVDTALVVVEPDQEFITEMLMAEVAFWDFVSKDIEPPLTAKDTVLLEDQSSVFLFSRIKKVKTDLKRAEALVKQAMDKLAVLEGNFNALKEEAIEHVEALGHTKFYCQGITIYKNSSKNSWTILMDKEKPEGSGEVQALKQA